MATYTVRRGDCLWNIAKSKLGDPYRWTEIADLNNISRSRPIIRPGQVLTLPGGSSSTSTSKNNSNKAEISYFGLQAGTDTTVFAAWKWDKSNTEKYEVKWHYATGNGLWFSGNSSTVDAEDDKQSVYSAPSNATKVKFKVKPISKKKTVNKKETSYWTAEWSTEKTYEFSDNPPKKPGAPNVELVKYKLTASLANLDVNGTQIEFQVVQDDTKIFSTGKATITTSAASYSCNVSGGHKYKVRCRAVRGDLTGEWSEYSNNVATPPLTPKLTVVRAESETSVYLEWTSTGSADSWTIQRTTKKEYFDGSDQLTDTTGIEDTQYLLAGLETGQEYFFRVRSVNDGGKSPWSNIMSVTIGEPPTAPTTWSSTTTGTVGDIVTLYWTHNAEDSSYQTYAEVEMYVDGVKEIHTINTVNEEDDEKTMYYEINTIPYEEGTKIEWRVRTAGVTKQYGDWSVQRTIDIYAPPTLGIRVTNASGNPISVLTSLPLYVEGEAGPATQTVLGYHVAVSANSAYETVDNVGNVKMVNVNENVYSKYFDTEEDLLVMLHAGNIDLENNITYTITVTVSMNSGLTATASAEFSVSWSDEEYSPNAEIGIDEDSLTAIIRPYLEDVDGNLISGVTLSVYRREYDGSFTEIITGLDNSSSTYITDPHPSLDFARYRIVATSTATGAVSYSDIPGYPVDEPSIVVQWDESWTSFDTSSEDELEQPAWSGSLLKLPYNVDVSEANSPDTSMVSYIGRKHPVSYYGTHIGTSASWSTVIPKSDKETLYALRRLQVWMGDVYVREPSGVGYWANIKVGFNQKHKDPTIPISFDITRVEGGA